MEELREVIGVLRDGEEGTERPQPTLADIPGLVEESRAAGMRVEREHRRGRRVRRRDRPHGVPDRPGGPHQRAQARAGRRGERHGGARAPRAGWLVEVVSRRGGRRPAAGPPPPGTGTGLIGLAERVALAGGEFEHGPRLGGDHVLRATLP